MLEENMTTGLPKKLTRKKKQEKIQQKESPKIKKKAKSTRKRARGRPRRTPTQGRIFQAVEQTSGTMEQAAKKPATSEQATSTGNIRKYCSIAEETEPKEDTTTGENKQTNPNISAKQTIGT